MLKDDVKEWLRKLAWVEAGTTKGQFTFLVMLMSAVTLLMLVMSVLMLSWVPLLATLFGWAVIVLWIVMRGTLLEKAAGGVGSILVPSGGTTPSVAQHSQIETMEARGEYARAAEAYRGIIESDPADLVACEKLARLAIMELKDYEVAVFAYRAAAERTAEPRRRMGFELLVVNIYRDNLKDLGRTVVELRRFLERWPEVPNAEALRRELAALKAEHFEGR